MRIASPLVAFALAAVLATSAHAQEAKKLSDPTVPAATSVAADDLFYIMQSGVGKKIAADDLSTSFWELLDGGSGDTIADLARLGGQPAGQTLSGATVSGSLVLQSYASGSPTTITLDGSNDQVTVSGSAGNYARFEFSSVQAESRFQIPIGDGSFAACLAVASDKYFHDTDCDGSADAGEANLANGVEVLYLGANDLTTMSGSPTFTIAGTLVPTVMLPDSATTEVGGIVMVPSSLAGRTFAVHLYGAPTSSGSCNFRLAVEYKLLLSTATAINTAGTSATDTIAASGTISQAINSATSTSIATSSTTVGVALALSRFGSDLGDTCANQYNLVGIRLVVQ